MIERETVVALIEASEKLDAALDIVSGLRTLLAPGMPLIEPSLRDDPRAVCGALVLVHEGVLHANALIHSILDKGR